MKSLIAFVVVVCGLVNLVESGAVSELEKYLEKIGATEDNALEKSLEALEGKKVGNSVFHNTGTLINTLKSIKSFCDKSSLSENGIASLRKEVTQGKPLAIAIENELNEQLGACANFYQKEYDYSGKLSYSKSIEPLVEEIAKVGGLCNGIDQTQPLWQYECMEQLNSFDSNKLGIGALSGLKRIDSNRYKSIVTRGEKEKETDYKERVRRNVHNFIYDLLDVGCRNYKRIARTEDYTFKVLYNLLTLNKIATRYNLEADKLEEVKKAAGTAHLCEFANGGHTIVPLGTRISRIVGSMAYHAS